jgi:hypothetical protein
MIFRPFGGSQSLGERARLWKADQKNRLPTFIKLDSLQKLGGRHGQRSAAADASSNQVVENPRTVEISSQPIRQYLENLGKSLLKNPDLARLACSRSISNKLVQAKAKFALHLPTPKSVLK